LADCDLGTAVTSTVADATGSATFTRPVVRYIATSDGPRDCAVEACVLAVAQLDGLVPDLSTAASAPIALAPVPVADGLTVAYDPPAYLEVDPAGPVTVPAVLGCDDSTLVSVTFRLWQ